MRVFYILLVLVNIQLFAQKTEYISGVIFNLETEKPIKNVNVKLLASSKGTITDSRGVFYIKVEKFPVKIVISHVAYNDTIILIKDTYFKEIPLMKSKNIINEVSVFAIKKVKELTKKKFFDLNDFEFMGDSLVLLAYDWQEKQNPWLILMNNNGDTLAKTAINIDGKFYKDCMGEIHVLTEDKAYQIYFNGQEFELLYPNNIEKFKQIIEPCVQSLNNKLYIQQYSYKNQILSYYSADKNNDKNDKVRVIADWVGARRVYDMQIGVYSVELNSDADIRFEEMCFFAPIYAPMVKSNDTICILNFIDNQLEFYNKKNKKVKTIPISFHKKKDWKQQVFVDDKTGCIYTLFKKNGKTSLKQIDKNTGEILKSTDIPNYRWIEKIIVHNNTIYFMYRKNQSLELMRLFRLNI